MNLIIDPELVVSYLKGDADLTGALASHRCWIYLGSLPEIESAVGSNDSKWQDLKDQVQWLAALAEDAAESDSEARMAKAASRLGGEIVKTIEDIPEPEQEKIDFIDLKGQQDQIRPELERRLHQVLHHGRYVLGPEVSELEKRLADYVGVAHCLGVSSGTDSLLVALMALGVGPGDEVITVPYTWISTAEVVALIGAKPVFVDIESDTWNMDPSQVEAAITDRTKAIMPVGIYGQTADMDPINAIAEKHGLPVIEDAAQSFGSEYKGRKSCALSTVGSTSFFPSKPLGGYGDGGALFTDDEQLVNKMRAIHVHGQTKKHYHPLIGLNARLDAMQAAVVLAKMDIFDEEVKRRAEIGAKYNQLFEEAGAESAGVQVPVVGADRTSVFAQYTIQVPDRDGVQKHLNAEQIPSVGYYIVPLHHQPCFESLGHQKGDFPVTEQLSDRCLSLPMNPNLTHGEQKRIVDGVIGAC